MKRKIYVASSWRNTFYPEVVAKLREAGHNVYDFRNPPSGDPGFKWSGVSEDYMEWTPQQYRDMLIADGIECGRKFIDLIALLEGYIHEAVIGTGSLLILLLTHLIATGEHYSHCDCKHYTNLLHFDHRFD